MKALSAEWTTSSYGFNSKYQIKEQLEHLITKTNYFHPLSYVDTEELDQQTQLQVSSFIDFVRERWQQLKAGQAAKQEIVEFYLASNDEYTKESKQVLSLVMERLDISKAYVSQVKRAREFRNEMALTRIHGFIAEHPVTVQYQMSKLSIEEIDAKQKTGHHFSKRELEARFTRVNNDAPKPPTDKQVREQELLEKYQGVKYLDNFPKAAEVYDSKPSNAAVFAAAMRIIADQSFKNPQWVASLRHLRSLIDTYLDKPVYRQ